MMIIVMRWQNSLLISPQSPKGILDIEFAKTPERFHQLKLFLSRNVVIQNIYFDFLFIAAYSWFLITVCKTASNNRSNLFLSLSIAAGAFDVLENFLIILVWNERFDPSVLQLVFYIAAVKFLLIVLVVGYIILSLFGLFKKESSV